MAYTFKKDLLVENENDVIALVFSLHDTRILNDKQTEEKLIARLRSELTRYSDDVLKALKRRFIIHPYPYSPENSLKAAILLEIRNRNN